MQRCSIGGCFRQPIEDAHIKSRGSGGSKEPHNIIKLCSFHHRISPRSFHNIGIWSFANLHNLIDRFNRALDLEREIQAEKYKAKVFKAKNKPRKICPTCKRNWSRGILKGDHHE